MEGGAPSARRLAWLLAAAAALGAVGAEQPMQARERMVREDIAGRGVTDERVLRVLRAIPREEFVPEPLRGQAYRDHPLPIGHGQTISQPYIVAAMTELARVPPGGRVLEVGTGSGYQAAVLARLAGQVYSIELVEPLGRSAAERLQRLGYTNVQVRVGDGYLGWPEHAPFDAIVVTCGADHVPPPLVEQLKVGGRMVIPVGSTEYGQSLQVIEKLDPATVRTQDVMGVRFVPLLRK